MPSRYSPSPEFVLVAACCRWPDDACRRQAIADALQRKLDWTLVSRVIRRRRAAGLMHHGLHPHAAELRAGLAARLKAQAMVIKGAPLSVQAYQSIFPEGVEESETPAWPFHQRTATLLRSGPLYSIREMP